MIRVYFLSLFWNLAKIFTQRKWGQIIVGSAYFVILGLVALSIYFLGVSTFRFLYTFSYVSQPIIRYLLLTALALTTIVSVSSFLIALSHRLFDQKLKIFFIAPVSPLEIFQAVFWENLILGGWAFLILAFPLLLAYLMVSGSGLALLPLLLLLFAMLSVLTESLGAILAIVFRYYFGSSSKKVIFLFIAVVVVVFAVIFKNLFFPTGLGEIAQRPTLQEVFAGLSSLPVASFYLPPALFLDSLAKNFSSFLFFLTQTLIFYLGALLAAKKIYRPTWQKNQEGIFLARIDQKLSRISRPAQFTGFLPSLLKKEFLLIDRSPSLLLYFSFVLFLSLVFFILLSQSPRSPEFSPFIFPKIVAAGMVVIGYFLTMLAVRFAFPSIVLEFDYFWLFSTLPKIRVKIHLAKWLAQTILVGATSLILGILAFLSLRLPFDFLPFLLVLCLTYALLICAINLFIGTFWASHLPRGDVEQTTTALPAVAATLFSILISFLGGILFYRLIVFVPSEGIVLNPSETPILILGGVFFFSLVLWILSFFEAQKKFEKMDIR